MLRCPYTILKQDAQTNRLGFLLFFLLKKVTYLFEAIMIVGQRLCFLLKGNMHKCRLSRSHRGSRDVLQNKNLHVP